MQDVSHIPRPAFVLGWLGVIPFAAFALLAVTGGVLPHGSAMSGLVPYGAIILSFMGGAQWGLSMVTGGGTLRTRLAITGNFVSLPGVICKTPSRVQRGIRSTPSSGNGSNARMRRSSCYAMSSVATGLSASP